MCLENISTCRVLLWIYLRAMVYESPLHGDTALMIVHLLVYAEYDLLVLNAMTDGDHAGPKVGDLLTMFSNVSCSSFSVSVTLQFVTSQGFTASKRIG